MTHVVETESARKKVGSRTSQLCVSSLNSRLPRGWCYAALSSMHNLCGHYGSSACLDAPGRLFIGHGHDVDVSRISPREAAIRAASKSIFDCREPASQSARKWI
jgi:hypothetical protein